MLLLLFLIFCQSKNDLGLRNIFTMQKHAFIDMDHPFMSRQNLLGALSLRTKNIIADTELQ